MTLILFTGAGFSRNLNGWLADEAFEYLLGCDGLHPRTRMYLWNHKEKGTGFEGVYQALKNEATNPTDQEVFKQFHDMVAGMFHTMRHGFEGQELFDVRVIKFLCSFDAIFTLNQDTLLELQYLNQDIRLHSHGRFLGAEAPGLKNANASEYLPPGYFTPRDGPYAVQDRFQPYFKLHGSSNWVLPDGSGLMLLLGGNKAIEIPKQPLLKWYHDEFQRSIAGNQVVIAGYGFGDEHINQQLCAAAAKGTTFFIIDLVGVDIIDKRKPSQIPQPRKELMTTLMDKIDGASRRPLISTLTTDNIERQKLYHFMTASERTLRRGQ